MVSQFRNAYLSSGYSSWFLLHCCICILPRVPTDQGRLFYPRLLWTMGELLLWFLVVDMLHKLSIFLSTPNSASTLESIGQELVEMRPHRE